MKKSRYYQNLVQTVGSIGEIVLFFSGYFLGKGVFIVALTLLIMRIIFKISVSELMYKRMKAVIREESNGHR